jgi:putative heme-binding domain-containing protein
MMQWISVPAAMAFLLTASLTTANGQQPAGQYTQADIERGSRLYGANCTVCHGANGEGVPNIDLRSGKFRTVTSDAELGRVIVAGVPAVGMPPHNFETGEIAGLVAYIRNMRDPGGAAGLAGDASRGRAIFEGKGKCLSCHRVNGSGSRTAPDLSGIGSVRSAEALEATLSDPTATMMPINRPVRAVTKEGRVINGRRLNEDTYSVQLMDDHEHLVALLKSDLKEFTVSKVSPMPSYKNQLNTAELGDLGAYLLSLKEAN